MRVCHRRRGGSCAARRGTRGLPGDGGSGVQLAFADDQYARDRNEDEVWAALASTLEGAETVLVPGFPLLHSDHRWVTSLLTHRLPPGLRLGLYVEQPYAVWESVGRQDGARRVAARAGQLLRTGAARRRQRPALPTELSDAFGEARWATDRFRLAPTGESSKRYAPTALSCAASAVASQPRSCSTSGPTVASRSRGEAVPSRARDRDELSPGRPQPDRMAPGQLLMSTRGRELRPVEVILLVALPGGNRGARAGVGCGAGRLLGYRRQLSSEAYGIDLSPVMADHCGGCIRRRTWALGTSGSGACIPALRSASSSPPTT